MIALLTGVAAASVTIADVIGIGTAVGGILSGIAALVKACKD